jgi:outer membrane receptor protein involved in Fe transport
LAAAVKYLTRAIGGFQFRRVLADRLKDVVERLFVFLSARGHPMPFRSVFCCAAGSGAARWRAFARQPMPACLWHPLLGWGVVLALVSPARAATDLTALSLEQLMDIPVTGASKYEQKQNEVAAAVSVISREEIRAFGWRTLGQALASLPGIHTTYDRQYTYLGARGLGLPGDYNTRVLITINGNRVNESTYDSAMVGHAFPLDMDLVERIEYIPGPGSAVYGQNAMFGVVNLVTRAGKNINGAEVSGARQTGHLATQGRLSVGQRLEDGTDVLVSVSGLDARGQDHRYDFGNGVAGLATRMDGERDQEVHAQWARGPWSYDLTWGDRLKADPTAAEGSDPLVPGQNIRDRYLLTQLRYEDSLADARQRLMARVFLSEYRFDSYASYSGVRYLFTGASRSRGAELRWLSTAWSDHRVMVGLELQDDPQRDQGQRDLEGSEPDFVLRNRGWRAGLYAQDEWRLSETLVATVGGRVDRNSIHGTRLSPRLAFIWRPEPASTLRLLYGTAHRAPNAYETNWTWDGEKPELQDAVSGERIRTLELVMDRRVGPDLVWRGALYRWDLRDAIVFDGGTYTFRSEVPLRATGLEVSADKTWSGGARLRGSLSRQWVGFADGRPVPNAPPWLAKLAVSAPLSSTGLRLAYEWSFVGRRHTTGGAGLGGYAVSSVHLLAPQILPRLELSVGIANLFNKRHAHPLPAGNWMQSLAQDGRSATLKLTYRF